MENAASDSNKSETVSFTEIAKPMKDEMFGSYKLLQAEHYHCSV